MRIPFLALVLGASVAHAEVGVVLQHSGYLLDAGDQPIDMPAAALSFRLFASGTGGTPSWTGTCSVAVKRGYYAVALGESCGPALTSATFASGGAGWLEVVVGTTVLQPRGRLGAFPAAATADEAQLLGGIPASGFAQLQSGTTVAQAGSLHVGGAVKAASFEGSGAAITGVNAASVGGQTLGQLDARYAPASGGSGGSGGGPLGTGGTCDASQNGALSWYANGLQVCDGLGWRAVTLAVAPTVTAVLPTRGKVAGGTLLTISGSGFSAGARVFLGDAEMTGVTVVNATTITALTPASATTGPRTVKVLLADRSAAQLVNGFAYSTILLGEMADHPALSCKQVFDANESRGTTTYWLDPDGTGGNPAFEVWCDMSIASGGWTIVWASNTGDAGDRPYADTAYGTDPTTGKYKVRWSYWKNVPHTEHILIRKPLNLNRWLRVSSTVFASSGGPVFPGHNHYGVTLTSSSGQTASVTLGTSDVSSSGGGWYGIAASIDHHSATYIDLNSSCGGNYVFTYGGDFFATNTALGTGWPQTSTCDNTAAGNPATMLGLR